MKRNQGATTIVIVCDDSFHFASRAEEEAERASHDGASSL